MATYNKFYDYSEQLARGVHNFGSHTFKVALTNTAPVATNTILADITQISGTNGYTTGGTATTITLTSTAGLPATGFLLIENETVQYGYISGNVLNNCFRGQNGTTAAAHSTGVSVYTQNLPSITVWPTPDNSTTYQFVYWRMRRIDDAGSGVNTMDVPFRFIPCMVAGLAYYLSLKVPNGLQRTDMLKQQYDEAWQLASDEDREKASIRLVPRQMFIN